MMCTSCRTESYTYIPFTIFRLRQLFLVVVVCFFYLFFFILLLPCSLVHVYKQGAVELFSVQ